MVFKHDTGVFNIYASLDVWLKARLDTNKPPAVTTVTFNVNFPEQPLVFPSWSSSHLGADSTGGQYQGNNVESGKHGVRRFGLWEINCWVSRKNLQWSKQVRQMADAVTYAINSNHGGVRVYDFYTDEQAPTALNYRVTLGPASERDTAPDPNPDVERIRLIIPYHWVERV